MPDSKREAALKALKTKLDNLSGPTVQRNGVEPEKIPAGGLVILRDGDPGPPVEETLSPHTYHYEHQAEIEVFVQQGTPSARDTTFDSILHGIATVVDADKTLGGVVDWAEVREPDAIDEEPVDGGNDLKRAVVPVILHYATTSPLQ
jgi:hypothetical protein